MTRELQKASEAMSGADPEGTGRQAMQMRTKLVQAWRGVHNPQNGASSGPGHKKRGHPQGAPSLKLGQAKPLVSPDLRSSRDGSPCLCPFRWLKAEVLCTGKEKFQKR